MTKIKIMVNIMVSLLIHKKNWCFFINNTNPQMSCLDKDNDDDDEDGGEAVDMDAFVESGLLEEDDSVIYIIYLCGTDSVTV